MDKKRMLIIRITVVVVLIAIAWTMTIVGRGHTIYLDCKKLELDGTTWDTPYKVEVYTGGERVAKLYDNERGSCTCIGQKLKMELVVIWEKGGKEETLELSVPIPKDLDGVVINLPGLMAGLPQSDYMTEFVSLATTEETEEVVSDDFGLEGMDGFE